MAKNTYSKRVDRIRDKFYDKIIFLLLYILNRNTTVVKWWNDNISRTLDAGGSIDCSIGDAPTVFPSYPGLTFVACVGGHGNGASGLLVSGNKWIFNTDKVQRKYTGTTWYLVYKGTEE